MTLGQVLAVQPGEGRRVSLLFLHYVWVVAVTIAGKSVRDVYFLTRYDKSILPLMAVAAGIVVAIAVAVFTRLENRFRAKVLVPLVALTFAITLGLLQVRLEGWTIPALYVWMEVINVITVLQFWLLAAEIFDARQAKRLFPLIGGGGSIAAMLIGPQLKPFSKTYGSDTLLWLVCGLLVVAALVGIASTRLPRVPVVRSQKSKSQAHRSPLSPYLKAVAAVVICAAVVAAIIDYQFKIISSSSLRTETDLVGFFGQFYAATGFSTLLLQFIVASRAYQRFGVISVMATLPISLGLGSVSILFWPVLASAVFAKFSDQTFRFTLHNGGLELLWLPVSIERRREAKPFISGSLKSITEGLVGVAMFLLLRFLTPAQLSFISVSFCGAWIFTMVRLRHLYISELQSAIEKRQLPPEDLEVTATDALAMGVIKRTLSEGDTVQRLFVLNLIEGFPLAPWRDTLRRLLDEGEPAVKARILEFASSDHTIVTDDYLKRLVGSSGKEAVEAIRTVGRAGFTGLADTITTRANDDDPSVRAAALAALIKLDGHVMPNARANLDQMIRSPKAAERAAALVESESLDGVATPEVIEAALTDSSRDVRAKALEIATSRPDPRYAKKIVDCLSNPFLWRAARNALAVLPAEVVLPLLADRLEKTFPVSIRKSSLRAIRLCLLPEAAPLLLKQIDEDWPILANEASDSLLALARRMPTPDGVWQTVEARRGALLQSAVKFAGTLRALPDSPDAILLRDYLETSLRGVLPSLIRLAALTRPNSPVETCVHIVQTRDQARLPFVLEFLDSLLTPTEREKLAPILDQARDRRDQKDAARSNDAPAAIRAWMLNAVYSEDEWLCAIAMDYILHTDDEALLGQLDWKRIPPSRLVAEVLAGRARRDPRMAVMISKAQMPTVQEGFMFTTLEKTILLKSVSLFETIPGEELSRVAQIAEEVSFEAGTIIFREKDHADCLYVVASGSVHVKKGDIDLATLHRGSSLGEMAILDNSPRSADAVAAEKTITLKVAQDQFLETMHANPEITQGVIRLLLARLRSVDEKLAGRTEAEKVAQ